MNRWIHEAWILDAAFDLLEKENVDQSRRQSLTSRAHGDVTRSNPSKKKSAKSRRDITCARGATIHPCTHARTEAGKGTYVRGVVDGRALRVGSLARTHARPHGPRAPRFA